MDYNATTPLHEDVLEAMIPFLTNRFGNASSYYQLGRDAREAVEQARQDVASSLGAQAGEIVFTGGGTESDNMALRGVAHALRRKGRHIITSAVEHHAVLRTAQALAADGLQVDFVPVNAAGRVDPDAVARLLRPDTVLVSIMAANNETGVVQPIREIAAATRTAGVVCHTDAVQAMGKIPVNVNDWGVDLLTLTAHKLYGPKGVGALYVRSGTPLISPVTGGHHEHDLRAGTENVAGIVGLSAALNVATRDMAAEAQRLTSLRERLEQGLAERLEGVTVNGGRAPRVPNTSNLSFAAVDGESLILDLDLRGICAATGSACTTGEPEPSHVLLAMGLEPRLAQGAVRISLGKENTAADVDRLIEVLTESVPRLRRISSFA